MRAISSAASIPLLRPPSSSSKPLNKRPERQQGFEQMIFSQTASVQAIGEELVRAALDRFGPRGLAADKFSLTLVLHPDAPSDGNGCGMLPRYAYRGDAQFYPCSVVKMFYLVAAQAA